MAAKKDGKTLIIEITVDLEDSMLDSEKAIRRSSMRQAASLLKKRRSNSIPEGNRLK
jgi:hypothetical protein